MSTVYLEQILLEFPRPVATILKPDGTEFAGGNICNKVKIPHPERFNIVRERADNSMSFIEPTPPRGKSEGFEIDMYSEFGVEEFYEYVGRSASDGIFILERPPLWSGPTFQGWRHYIRFFYADITTHFELVTETRKAGSIQWHRASVENVEIIDTVRF